MKTPSITLVQILATVSAVLGLAAAFGLSLNQQERDGIIQVITVGYPVALTVDAIIRGMRTKVVVAQHALAVAQLQHLPADGNDAIIPAQPAQS